MYFYNRSVITKEVLLAASTPAFARFMGVTTSAVYTWLDEKNPKSTTIRVLEEAADRHQIDFEDLRGMFQAWIEQAKKRKMLQKKLEDYLNALEKQTA